MGRSDFDFDVVVIGSGFGGSVMTCRLAEKGYSVCLLERGKRYGFGQFPRQTHEAEKMFWDPEDKFFGLYDVNFFPKSDANIVCASGLGGGSLVYANVLMKVPEDFFKTWPGGITREEMDPYYEKVLEMMEAGPYPYETDPYYQDTPKTRAMKKAFLALKPSSGAVGNPEWIYPPLAVRFEGEFPGAQSRNNQGVIQSSCTKCGECDIGCNIYAKNTLDLNYIARAENQALLGNSGKAAAVKTNAQVYDIVPSDNGGYIVYFRDPRHKDSPPEKIYCERVVLSAGSYGSTSLLLKLKQKGNLPHLSSQLGRQWCGNGDLEGSILKIPKDVNPTVGPVITGAIACRYKDYPDGFPHGLFIQDAGFPSFIAWYLIGKLPSPSAFGAFLKFFYQTIMRILGKNKETRIGDDIISLLDRDDQIRHTMILLGMGRDRSNGRLYMDKSNEIMLDWQMEKGSELHFKRVRKEMAKLAKAMGGKFQDNPLTYFNKVIAVHPLGGCVMAESAEEGVVNVNGEAFGHPGLYVVDAGILPSSTGVNPSLTIAAMAERIAERF